MELIPPSFAETFEKHKLFEGSFPHAEKGVKWFSRTYGLAKLYVLLVVLNFPWSVYAPLKVKEYAYTVKGFADGLYYGLVTASWLPEALRMVLEFYRDLWVGRFVFLPWILATWCVIYLSYVVRRQRLYEREVIVNDYLSYAGRKAVLEDFDIRQRLSDLDTQIQGELSSEDKSSRKTLKAKVTELEQEKQAVKNISKTMIIYNTRENLSHKVRKTVTVYFYTPSSLKAKEAFDKLKEPFIETAEIVLQQFFSDEREREESVRGNTFVQAVVEEVADPYYYDKELADLEKLATASNYFHSAPYNAYTYKGREYQGLSDKSVINEKRRKDAKRWANTLTDEVSAVLRQNGFNASFSHLSIESRTVELFYKLPKNFKKPNSYNKKGIEEVIQEQVNSSNKPSISIGIDTVRVSIALPNGKDMNGNETDNFVQLLDTETILRRNFG